MKRFEKLTFQRETQKLKWNYDIATMINLVTMTKKFILNFQFETYFNNY